MLLFRSIFSPKSPSSHKQSFATWTYRYDTTWGCSYQSAGQAARTGIRSTSTCTGVQHRQRGLYASVQSTCQNWWTQGTTRKTTSNRIRITAGLPRHKEGREKIWGCPLPILLLPLNTSQGQHCHKRQRTPCNKQRLARHIICQYTLLLQGGTVLAKAAKHLMLWWTWHVSICVRHKYYW